MFPWQLYGLVGFTLLVCAGALLFLWPIARLRKQHLELLATGTPATGRVLSLQATNRGEGSRLHRVWELRLEIEVRVPGKTPYIVHTRQLVDDFRTAQVQPGQQVQLCVDPRDPQRVVLTASPDASIPGAAEPLFDLTRSREVFRLISGFAGVCVAAAVALGAYSYWDLSNQPKEGFCAAAVRCCNMVPPTPFLEPATIKLLNVEFDMCSISADTAESGCRGLYDYHKQRVRNAGLSCE